MTVRIHQSLALADHSTVFEGNFTKVSIEDAMSQLLSQDQIMKEICLKKGKRKPGILYISDKTELGSLGLLEQPIDSVEILEIRIVPILHGG